MAPDSKVTLCVGGKTFITTRDTLTSGSDYFVAMLSDRWSDPSEDEPHFIDAEPKIFEHILRYLRRGSMPLLYDKETGHDYAEYNAILRDAEYFQVVGLVEWIQRKEYLKAVTVEYSIREVDFRQVILEKLSADVERTIHVRATTNDIYMCPNDIKYHQGNPGRCGKRCWEANGRKGGITYKKVTEWRTLIVEKRIVFKPEISNVRHLSEV